MRLFLLFFCLIVSMNTFAKNTGSSGAYQINKIYMYSKYESIYPEHKGLVQITFTTDITWNNNGSCSPKSVVVRNEDDHLISSILAAKAMGQPIFLYADDELQVASQCYLRAVGY